jgi:hypothetical protein
MSYLEVQRLCEQGFAGFLAAGRVRAQRFGGAVQRQLVEKEVFLCEVVHEQ